MKNKSNPTIKGQTESIFEHLKNKQDQSLEDIEKDLRWYKPASRDLRDFVARIYQNDKCVFRNEYIAKRFLQSVFWYSKKAFLNKVHFLTFSVFAIALPIFSTTLTTISDSFVSKIIVGIFSAFTAILTAFLTLFKFQHNWIQFRSTSEELQTELSLLLSEVGIYDKQEIEKEYRAFSDSDDEITELTDIREKLFLRKIEKIMAKEKSQWESLNKPSK